MTEAGTDLRADVLRMLGEIKRCDATRELGEAQDFVTVLRFDSLDVVNLAVQLDRRYGIKLGEQATDMDALAGVDALAALVAARRAR